MAQVERQQSVLNILQGLRNLDGLKRLFWQELNYERENKPLSARQWPDDVKQALAEGPVLFANGGEESAFHVIYCRLAGDTLLRGQERPIVNQLLGEHPYALFVFSNKAQSDWRFLNVKYAETNEKRRLFRRITVRPGDGLRTAAERMQRLDLSERSDRSDWSALEIQQRHDDAFDVESVTKDFYKELANWYFWALRYIRFPRDAPKDGGHDHVSVIRLITRLIFCWFVKEKRLIPEALFDRHRLAKVLVGFEPEKSSSKDSVFYRAVLQNLFFATLNTEMDQRGWRREGQNFMAHSLYRFKEYFRDPKSALDLFQDIPFLNGGLFECLDKDLGEAARPRYVRIDGFSDRADSQVTAPDFLFFGPEREADLSEDYGDKKFKKVRVRGLIETLDRYKFTIEENTPLDQEVALDPELCGKVFENLLAAYNPETGTTARKVTGSFYTPREIVDYMVDEALVAFLSGALDKSDSAGFSGQLRRLLDPNQTAHNFSEGEVNGLIERIDALKALDPAVGSAAFPMGLLHKLVLALGKLDPNNERWKATQIAKLEDPVMREEAELVFRDNYDNYGRKLYLIENCIYGVDIQPIAVQIAKMRFFISLIVDQKVDRGRPNLGVRALPNLETKFVAANTLIGIDRPEQMLLRNPEIDRKEAQLRNVREKYFTAKTPATKEKWRDQDKKFRAEIAGLLKADGWDVPTARQLASWDPYDQNASAGFFDPEWMFGVTEGFDVVIGNPPYVRIQTLNQQDPDQVEFLKERYEAAKKGNYDLYVVFVEAGLNFLSKNGQLAFILPHKFFNAQYGEPLRELLAKGKHVRHVVHFADQQIFPGATNYVCLLFLSGAGAKACRWVRAADLPVWVATQRATETTLPSARLSAAEWNFAVGRASGLFDKLQRMPVKLGDVADIFVGLQTSADRVYVLKEVGRPKDGMVRLRDRAGREWEIERGLLRPFISDVSLAPYLDPSAGHWLVFPYELSGGGVRLFMQSEMKGSFPAGWRYLKEFERPLRQRESGKADCPQWYGYIYRKNLTLFAGPKLVVQVISKTGRYAYDARSLYFTGEGNGPYYGLRCSSAEERRSLRYLQTLLNSRLLDFHLHRISTTFRGGYFSYGKQFIAQLPIHPLDLSVASDRAEHDAIVKLVTRIVAAKQTDPEADTSTWETEIDQRVYRLYGLTRDEIAIVEGKK